MPIPYFYKKAAPKLYPYRKLFVGLTAIGYALWIIGMFDAKEFFNMWIVLGFILFIWPWGLYLIVVWYGEELPLGRYERFISTKLPLVYKFHQMMKKFIAWPGAFFLAVWFGIAVLFTWMLVRDGFELIYLWLRGGFIGY